MKKLLLLSAISVALFAGRYPIIAEYYYMSSCVNAAKTNKKNMIKYCECTLKEIENNYTFDEFINNMQNNKNQFLKDIAKKAIPKCINLIVK